MATCFRTVCACLFPLGFGSFFSLEHLKQCTLRAHNNAYPCDIVSIVRLNVQYFVSILLAGRRWHGDVVQSVRCELAGKP